MGATVLDSLVVQFALDPTEFQRGQAKILDDVKVLQEQAKKAGDETEASTKKISEVFSGMKREFLGFLGIAVGGYEARRFFDFLVNLDASTSRLSRSIGVNVQDLSAWQSAARSMGGTGQEVAGTIMRLGQEVWNFRFGAGSNLPGQLRALGGINVFDGGGNPKTGIQLLREMGDAVERLQMPTAGKAAFMRMLGLDETTIQLLIQGRVALDKLLEAMRQAGTTTEESGRAAEKFQKDLAEVETAAIDVGRAFAGPMLAGLSSVIEKFKEWDVKKAGDLVRWVLGPDTFKKLGLEGVYGEHPEADARARLAAGFRAAQAGQPLPSGVSGPAGGGSNWENFLSGLSYLETTQTGAPSGSSTAEGYFQFLRDTAAKARGAGIGDPRYGSYGQQAGSTQQYIKKFYPEAAAAIDRGDFRTAIPMLAGEWPSLPGGSQPQNAARYATFAQELRGGGPRPPGGGGMNVTISNMTVNSKADDAGGIARDIKAELQRTDFTAQVPQGLQ